MLRKHRVIGLAWVMGVVLAVFSSLGRAVAEEIKPLTTDGSLSGYTLAWHDEFEGKTLNADEWDYRRGTRFWSTNRAENVSVGGGLLRIALKKEQAQGKEYTAGGIISKRSFKFGYYEARFKVPAGKGWHTSFWMTNNHKEKESTTSEQEIDVCENDSIHLTGYGANLHRWRPTHKAMGPVKVKTPDLSADFHVWGCVFTPQQVVFYFEGKKVGKLDVSKLKLSDQNIWLTAIASPLGKTDKVDDSKLPAEALFDWVRFYAK